MFRAEFDAGDSQEADRARGVSRTPSAV
jgi:hypothetical protein